MGSVFNFCAGPAMLPQAVMQQAQKEFIDWQGLGVSVMELSHRGNPYMKLAAQAEQDLRDLLAVPDDYKVLFCHGGGRGQFAAIPLNLLGANGLDKSVDYAVNGSWSKGAAVEGSKYARVNSIDILRKDDAGLQYIAPSQEWQVDTQAAYLHYCPNETIEGIEINETPVILGADGKPMPLVADMSSNILSKPIDVSKFGLIYAGAQKNIGPSGLAIVIVHESLIQDPHPQTPAIYNYKEQAALDSMLNTPPTYAWYLAGLVFQWLKRQGGVEAMAERNQEKAQLLYDYIDASELYRNGVHLENRSRMNVPFQLADDALDASFLDQSEQAGLMALKGHRIVGGMRASIYNAMPQQGVDALVAFMTRFAEAHQ